MNNATLDANPTASPRAAGDSRPCRRDLVLLDPGLFFEGGHHATLARLLQRESARSGFGLSVFAGEKFHTPLTGVRVRHHFRTSPYAALDHGDPDATLRRINRWFTADLNRLPPSAFGEDSVALVPTLTSRLVLGFAEWLADGGASLPGTFRAILMFPPGFGGDERLRAAELGIYREALDLLSSVAADRIALFAETAPIAEIFGRLGALPVTPISWPVFVPGDDEPMLSFDSRELEPMVCHVGYTKRERGAALLPDIVRQTLRDRPLTRFTIQSWQIGPDQVDAQLSATGDTRGRVRLIRGSVSPLAFADTIRESDIVLLAYDPSRYRDRGSGVFSEAAACGKVMVLPEGTWMCREARARSLGFVSFDQFDAGSVAGALAEAIDRRSQLLTQASLASRSWRQDRSAGEFVRRVLERRAADTDRPDSSNAGQPGRVRVNDPSSDPDTDGYSGYTDGELWTPQTVMLRTLRSWFRSSPYELTDALSIDRNPELDAMVLDRWPDAKIELARYPEFDAQDLKALDDGTFDLVYSHQVLEHIPKPWRAASEFVRVLRPGGIGVHTTCAHNPRHGLPAFNDYYRFLPDGLEQLYESVAVLLKGGCGNRRALGYNLSFEDGHGPPGGRRFPRAIGEPNDPDFPWHTWIIFRKR